MKAALALESGRIFFGESFGMDGEALGEIVFNTGMCGYQEILTDPSYCDQIITMTYPHIGNYGTNQADYESDKSYARGLVVREQSKITSNWRSELHLDGFLKINQVVAIEGIDTRALTLHIREAGAMNAIISTKDLNPESLHKKVTAFPSMAGKDLVKVVKRTNIQKYPADTKNIKKAVLIDYGCKTNIIRCLTSRGCEVTVVPPDYSADKIMQIKPDGIMLSNGPGDPAAVDYAAAIVSALIAKINKPIFGICLGHQIISLALGGKTYKLKFGHRGVNQPVKNLATGKVEITSQNHGFNVDMNSLNPKEVLVTHLNLNDQTVEGIKHKKKPIFSVQYHPEASPGPRDSAYLFDEFCTLMDKHRT
ncbi:MAG: glutamine-hydrolyzing carbamoyl-phosphate synthase small subunit [bacterium]